MPIKYFPMSAQKKYNKQSMIIKKFMIREFKRINQDLENELPPNLSIQRLRNIYIIKYPKIYRKDMIIQIKKHVKKNKMISLLYETMCNTNYLSNAKIFIMMISYLSSEQLSAIGW